MNALLLLLTVFSQAKEDLPQAELVLKGQYRIGPACAQGIIPLGSRYLCFGDGYKSFGTADVRIFDRQTNKVVLTMNTPMKEIYALARHKGYIYALAFKDIFCIPLNDQDGKKVPILGPAQKIDLYGNEAEQLLHTATTVAVRTKTKKIYVLEDGAAKKERVINVPTLASDMIKENEDLLGMMLFKLINIKASTKLLVANTHRLRVYDLTTLLVEKDFRYEAMKMRPDDVTYVDGQFLIVFWDGLRVINSKGKFTDYQFSVDCSRIVYIKSKKVFLLTGIYNIFPMETIGKLEKPYEALTCIDWRRAKSSLYADDEQIYVGMGSYDRRDWYLGGGDLLEFEIKVNRR